MLTLLALVALVVALLAMVAAWLALRTLGRLRRSITALGRDTGRGRESFLEAVARHIELTERTRQQFDELSLSLLGAVERLESNSQRGTDATYGAFTAEIEAVRTDAAARIEASRGEVAARFEQLKQIVDVELARIREGVDAQQHTALADISAERSRLAADNTAAKNQLRAAIERVEQAIEGSLRRVALVRFDAFDDLSGRLSFCLALLDARGDGVTLTSLAGRTETRLYAKPITAGKSVAELSPEEHQALTAALGR